MKTGTQSQDALERLQEGIARLTTSQAWTGYLRVQSRFYRYSPNNCFLIWAQRPEASRVAGYRRWQELGRHVRKGERGIMILAPCKYKTENGEGEEELVVKGFRAAYVFDIEQTDGEPLAEIPISRLSGDAPAVMDSLTEYARGLKYSVDFADFAEPNKNGQTDFAGYRITLRQALSPAQTVKTMAHELAHILLNHISCKSRSVAELEAESVAFVVCDALGIDASEYSFAYVASWSNGSDDAIERIRDHAQRIQGTATQILATLGVEAGTR
jgi:antirestriction protein ArdC